MSVPAATVALGDRVRRLVTGGLEVPVPGSGHTWRRWSVLAAVAAEDLSQGRLVEGHLDAVAILAEADRQPRPGGHGVFAARGPDSTVSALPDGDGWRLNGRRRYASGVRVLDRALVDVDGPDGSMLVDLDLRHRGVTTVPGTWEAVGMAATDSLAMDLDDVPVAAEDVVGPPGFYVDRPGFGHGGCGVAACWWGGAVGLVRALVDHAATRPDGPRRRQVVAAAIAVDDAEVVLRAAAADLDRHPDDVEGARDRAAGLRWSMHRSCREVLDRVVEGGGTHPATTDPAHARRLADLPVYLTQFGGPATLDGIDPRGRLPDLRVVPDRSGTPP